MTENHEAKGTGLPTSGEYPPVAVLRACKQKGGGAHARSPGERPEPREAGRRLISASWRTWVQLPDTFCSSAFLWGWGLSYYAIFQELLDPAFCFSSCPLPWRVPWSGPGVNSSPVRGRPFWKWPNSPSTAHLPRPRPPLGINSCQHFGASLTTRLGLRTWKTPFSQP